MEYNFLSGLNKKFKYTLAKITKKRKKKKAKRKEDIKRVVFVVSDKYRDW